MQGRVRPSDMDEQQSHRYCDSRWGAYGTWIAHDCAMGIVVLLVNDSQFPGSVWWDREEGEWLDA